MTTSERLAQQAVRNAAMLNLDLDEEGRRLAISEAAHRLEVLAGIGPIEEGTGNVLRIVMSGMALADDQRGYLREVVRGLTGRTPPTGGTEPGAEDETVAAFLEITHGNAAAVISSDVPGNKGDFAIEDGRVVRKAGTTTIPYRNGASGLRAILEDGAYGLIR